MNRINSLPDRLAEVRAEIARLRETESRLVASVKARGESRISGYDVDAIVVEAERSTVAWKKIATDLGASKQRIAANTKKSRVVSVKIVSAEERKEVA